MPTAYESFLATLAGQAREADVFASVVVEAGLLKAHARLVESPCWYQLGPMHTQDRTTTLWVGLYTPDRWLSGSIEADVLHLGDKYEDLIEEELVDQGWSARLPVEHFRDDAKRFVFRSPITLRDTQSLDDAEVRRQALAAILAYEAAFRELGDMTPGED